MYYSNNYNSGSQKIYIKPEWICGRYDVNNHAALLYNLIEGLVYFFKDISADIISEIFGTSFNSVIDIEFICLKYDIQKDSIIRFFDKLLSLGILVNSTPTTEGIFLYRKKVGEMRLKKQMNIGTSLPDTNETFISAEVAYKKLVKPQVGVVQIELTYNCSEKCVHCYNPGAVRCIDDINKRHKIDELHLEDYIRIIDELYDLGVYKINLTGGDPFAKPVIWEIISYLHQKGIAFDIYTNGQIIADKMEQLLMYYPKSVSVSLYSSIKKVHDTITRTPGSYDHTISVIRQLSKYGVPMYIKCCIMKTNISSYFTVKDVVEQYGGILQYDYTLTDSLDGDKCVSNFLLLNDEELELIMQDEYIFSNNLKNTNQLFGYEEIYMDKKSCNGGDNLYCITPEGNVQICVALPWSMGNLKVSTFSEILYNSKNLQEWKNSTLSDFIECGRHEYCHYCKICAGHNYIEHGTIYKPALLNCRIAKVKKKLADKLRAGGVLLNREELYNEVAKISDSTQSIKKIQEKSYRI